MGLSNEMEQNCAAYHNYFPSDKVKDRSLCQESPPEDPVKVHRSFFWSKERGVKAFLVLLLLLLVFIAFQETSTLRAPLFPGGLSFDLVDDVLHAAPLIDTHNDFPIWVRAFLHNHIYKDNFTNTSDVFGQVDFPRLRKGRLRGQIWSVYVECPDVSGNFSDEIYREIVHDTLQQIDLVHRLLARFPEDLKQAKNAKEIWEQFTTSTHISSLIGVEGLHQIGNSASILRMYYHLGARYVTLTHECHNRYADSCSPQIPLHNGLSEAGISILREMNRIGMMVDLSHTSKATMWDALQVSRAPVLFSHSNSFSMCAHPRNVPDDILFRLQKNGGVIMVTFVPEFVRCGQPESASLDDVADHIEYIGELIGYRHVGLGADFDGMPRGPKGLEDVSKYPNLIVELARRGLSHAELTGLVGGNVWRVLSETEKVGQSMTDVLPLEDKIKPMFS